ncbi:MAG TPA: aldo/keto reductase [Stellaceae bacterium]|nr:aldo/keto reductase [Stellaceae bacterium]
MTDRSRRALSRIGLGTAQFGMAYGVTNRRGRVALDEARRILAAGHRAGIRVIDTAAFYGETEAVLGVLEDAACGFRIITKTPPIAAERIGAAEAEEVRLMLARSRQNLRRRRLDGVLVHHGQELLRPGGERILDVLREAKARGEVERIGVSVYDPDELAAVLKRFTPDLVQLPLNLLDQRFAASGVLTRLKAMGAEIHARSLFLQGTLLVAPAALPPPLDDASAVFAAVAEFLAAHGLDPLAGCLAYGLSLAEIDCLILGATAAEELDAILAAARNLPRSLPDFAALAVSDAAIIDPRRWRLSPGKAAL